MPEANSSSRPPAIPEAAREVSVRDDKREEVKQPLNEAQRRKVHLDKIKDEEPEERHERRIAELATVYETHLANVHEAHEAHPTPALPFQEMEEADQVRWNEKRKTIDSANRAYNRAVKLACAGHRDEDIHLAKVRATAKPAA